MTIISEFNRMLDQIQKERGIPREALLNAIKAALLSACRKHFANIDNLEVDISDTGEMRVLAVKTVVNKVKNHEVETTKAEAKKYNPKARKGSKVKIEVTPRDFGRLAAQTAKQVIIQRIREAEKEGVFEEFTKKQGEIVTGIVQRKEFGGYLVNLGRIETLLPITEQVVGEHYRHGDRIKVYVVETKKTPRGPHIVISRTHPGLVRKLFELEIPEITEGILEIKEVAREPGRRTKIALLSKDKNVGVVGTCVGHMGTRIQNITRELGTERVDIIEWNEETKKFITNALSPAKISNIEMNKEEHVATVIVPQDQLSLAIGKEGQNVRLGAKLTGWKIDIVSEEDAKKGGKAEKKEETEKAPKKKNLSRANLSREKSRGSREKAKAETKEKTKKKKKKKEEPEPEPRTKEEVPTKEGETGTETSVSG